MKIRDELSSLLTVLWPLAIFAGAMLAMLSAVRLGLVLWQLDRVSAIEVARRKRPEFRSFRLADQRFGKFHRAMLESGVYLPPSQYEAAFLSAVHSVEDIEQTIEAARKAFKEL